MTSLLREEMPVPMADSDLCHHHVVTPAGGRARHGQADDAGSDHQNLHAISDRMGGFCSKATWMTCLN